MFIDHLAANMTLAEFVFWLLMAALMIPAILTFLLNPRQSTCKHDWQHIDDTPTTRKFTCRLCRKDMCKQIRMNTEGDWVVAEDGKE